MCEYCRRAICPSGCPNSEHPKPVCECDLCNEGIYHGDRYILAEREGKELNVCVWCRHLLTEDEQDKSVDLIADKGIEWW